MRLGEEFLVFGEWFRIHFTENEGMAFGMAFGGDAGKVALSLFRIFAVIFIAYFLIKFIRQNAHKGLIIGFSLILAGAIGNIIDSVFYGVIFNHSFGQVATMFPEEGGYAPLLFGRVVDMFYFPIIQTTYPEWFPFWGGDSLIFFKPIFNVADAAITIGVVMILFLQKHLLAETSSPKKNAEG